MISTVSAQAFGENFFDLFAKWTSEIFHLDDSAKPEASIGHNDLEEGEVREYATPQEMLDDFGIKGQLIPTEVPEEFGAPTCWASNDESGLRLQIIYESTDHYMFFWYRQGSGDNLSSVEKMTKKLSSGFWVVSSIINLQITALKKLLGSMGALSVWHKAILRAKYFVRLLNRFTEDK